jgi:hypothetical protein
MATLEAKTTDASGGTSGAGSAAEQSPKPKLIAPERRVLMAKKRLILRKRRRQKAANSKGAETKSHPNSAHSRSSSDLSDASDEDVETSSGDESTTRSQSKSCEQTKPKSPPKMTARTVREGAKKALPSADPKILSNEKLKPAGTNREINAVVLQPKLSVMRFYRDFPALKVEDIREFVSLSARSRRIRWLRLADSLAPLIAGESGVAPSSAVIALQTQLAALEASISSEKLALSLTKVEAHAVRFRTKIQMLQSERTAKIQELAAAQEGKSEKEAQEGTKQKETASADRAPPETKSKIKSPSRSESAATNKSPRKNPMRSRSSDKASSSSSSEDTEVHEYEEEENSPDDEAGRDIPRIVHAAMAEGRQARDYQALDEVLQAVAALTDFSMSSLWLVWSSVVVEVKRSETAILCAACGLFAYLNEVGGRSCPICLTRQCASCARAGGDIHFTINRMGHRDGARSLKRCNDIASRLYDNILQWCSNEKAACTTCLLPSSIACTACRKNHFCTQYCLQMAMRDGRLAHCGELSHLDDRGDLNPLAPTIFALSASMNARERLWRLKHFKLFKCVVCTARSATETCVRCLSRDYCKRSCRERDRHHKCIPFQPKSFVAPQVAPVGLSAPKTLLPPDEAFLLYDYQKSVIPPAPPTQVVNRRQRRAAAAAAVAANAKAPNVPVASASEVVSPPPLPASEAASAISGLIQPPLLATASIISPFSVKLSHSTSHMASSIIETESYQCDQCSIQVDLKVGLPADLNAVEKKVENGECGGCRRTRYCSLKCQREHWTLGHKEACGAVQGAKTVYRACALCLGSHVQTFDCGCCKLVRYCSVVCQLLDWPSHKPFCVAAS